MSTFDAQTLLSELVSIPSVSGSEADVVDHVAGWCARRGFDCEGVGGGLVARVARGGVGPTLLLTSHLDTVPAGSGWTGDPWSADWSEGRLVALGANDAKASATGMLGALVAAAEDPEFRGTLLVALNAREETDNAGMVEVLDHLDQRDVVLDAAVVGEPTNLEVVRSQAGLAVLTAHWQGVACHAAHVDRREHVNALALAAQELAAFGSYALLPSEHPLFERSTLVPTQLDSGNRHNVVPADAEAVFDARLAPDHDAAFVAAYLNEHLPGAEVRVRSDRLVPFDTPADASIVRLALQLAGQRAASASSTLSDMALLGSVPAVKCGPGRTERSHTANEYVTQGELHAGCAFYARLAIRSAELACIGGSA